MMAIIGMFYQDGLTGSAWGDWALYEDSPLRSVARRAEPISAAAAAAAAAAAKASAVGAAAKASAVGAGAKAVTGTSSVVSTLGKRERPAYEPFGPGPFDPSKQVGALPPLNYWDPAGFTKDEATFRKYRTAEIKHARVAMTAAVGMLIQHSNKFAFIDSACPTGFEALENPSAQHAFAVLFLCVGFYELVFWKEDMSKAPGDFGDPAGWSTTFPGIQFNDELRNRELNNGRFAMFAIIGILVAENQTGLDAVDQISAATTRWSQMGGFENF